MGDLVPFYRLKETRQKHINQKRIQVKKVDDIIWQDFSGKEDSFPPGIFYQALMNDSIPWIAGIFLGVVLTPIFMFLINSI